MTVPSLYAFFTQDYEQYARSLPVTVYRSFIVLMKEESWISCTTGHFFGCCSFS